MQASHPMTKEKNTMIRKITAVLSALALVLGVAALFAQAQEAPAQPQQPSAGSVYYLNFKPEQAVQWELAAQRYRQKTGVPVTILTAASGTYEDTLRSEMEKTDPPTLFQVNGPTGLRTWRDWCLDLRDTALFKHLQSQSFALFDGEEVPAIAYAVETYGIICNRTLLAEYCDMENAVIRTPDDITSFETLKAVAQDIQKRRDELGVLGAFTSAGMDASSDWRFKTHLANLPIYYEYRKDGIADTQAIRGDYLPQFQQIWDLYLNNATCPPALIGARTAEDAASEFALGEAVFYQNGTWAYEDCVSEGLTDDELGMLPIYIGAEGEEEQGLCMGSENYWCINRHAAPEDIEATKAFLEWLITSEEGKRLLTVEMGFVTPFDTMEADMDSMNALQRAAQESLMQGRWPVSWAFTTIPSETWKNRLGAAMLEYAQGTGDWNAVRTAFVDGWADEQSRAE